MSFGLKNGGTTYHRLMDTIFTHKIWQNLEVYVVDMIAKMEEEHIHTDNLEDII